MIGLDSDIVRQIHLEGHEIRSLKIADIFSESWKEGNTAKRNFHHKIKGTVMQIEKALINDCLGVSKVP